VTLSCQKSRKIINSKFSFCRLVESLCALCL